MSFAEEQYVIRGGKPLEGEVVIAGAKNAALGILAAAVMTDEKVTIENVPYVSDTRTLLKAIENIGATVEYLDKHTVVICGKGIREGQPVDDEYIRRIRASYYLIGALLGKHKYANVALPGGCDIGSRPIDLHIKGFEKLGAETEIVSGGSIVAQAKELHGAHIYLDTVSVGATINIMMAASLSPGKTTIENAAKEPHIVDVANFLNTMGANIKGAGTDVIRVRGVEKLHGAEYSIIPDQIEAGTFMAMTVATRGNVLIKNVIPKHLEAISSKLVEMGAHVIEYDDSVRVMADGVLKATQIKTLPYPGFPTDMQAQMAAILGLADGTSIVTESIFENRFRYVAELARMGAKIRVEGNSAIITGTKKYNGATLRATDLRAGAALVIAALAANGVSNIENIQYIKRGYEEFADKVSALGGMMKVAENEQEVTKKKLELASNI